MPYRIDILNASDDAFDRLVELGAIDAEALPGGGFAAIMPDRVEASQVEQALGTNAFSIAPVTGRDADSVWLVSPRPIRVGRLQMLPAHREPEPGAVRLIDSAAFGTGLHPTTVLCLESLQEIVQIAPVDAVLDVGTGSGVLALGALALGVPRALGIDISDEALRVAAANARLNGMGQRLELRRGGPDRLSGRWPLVVANVLPAALIEMAPALVQRVGHHGELVLSGIPSSLGDDVDRAYRRLGMRRQKLTSRAGWAALVLRATW